MRRVCLNPWLVLSLLLPTGCGRSPLDEATYSQPGRTGTGGAASQAGGTSGAGGTTGTIIANGGSGGTPLASGDSVSGGAGSGGRASGGSVSAGAGSGGRASGGSVSAGAGSGGRASGGSVSAGAGSGGRTPAGGTGYGGTTTGGGGTGGYRATGGTATGGIATGGTATGGTATGGVATGGCVSALGSNEDLIDDMNDGDQYILQVSGRAGIWTDSHDTTPNATMWPDPSGPFQMAPTGDPCHGDAVHVYGGQFVMSADFGFTLGGFYNASAYTGVSFSLKNAASEATPLHVVFPDKDTTPDYGICSMVSAADLCWSDFGKRIAFPSTPSAWVRYTIRFSELTQDPWGHQAAAFDPATLYAVRFQITPGSRFDLWMDDVAFVR